jgi:putative nucleotidyltransferase with HDIG domain
MDVVPERYATTGLPLFLKAMIQAGADPANLKAQVAGGALIGEVSRQDLQLDIGGRTTEHVINFLKQARVPVERADVGGVWGCSMRLEMDSLKVEVLTGDWMDDDPGQTGQVMERDQLVRTLAALEPIPQIALRILRDYQDERYTLTELANELKQDQVLSAHTLKLANSALYQRSRKVSTIEDAVFLLGQDTVIKCVVSESIERLYNQAKGGYSLCQGGLFHHARKTALLCEKIAEAAGEKVKPALAYLAGLLHDIGKVVLDQYIHNAMPTFYRRISNGQMDWLRIEREVLGMDHTEAGGMLARKWDFADPFKESILFHHYPDDPRIRHRTLVGIVHVADMLLARFSPGVTLGFPEANQFADQLAMINLSQAQLHTIIDTIADGEFHLTV